MSDIAIICAAAILGMIVMGGVLIWKQPPSIECKESIILSRTKDGADILCMPLSLYQAENANASPQKK